MGDLTTLNAVKAYLPLNSNADDTLLGTLVTAVSAAIETWCGRTFALASYTDTYHGRGGDQLLLRHGPVVSVTSVSVDGVIIPQQPAVGQRGWVLDGSLLYFVGGCFTRGVQNVAVQLTAGFLVTPAEVAQAAVRWVARLYRERERLDVRSKGAANETTTYDIGVMPAFVQLALAPYRRVAAF